MARGWFVAALAAGPIIASPALAAPGDPARAGATTIEVVDGLPAFSGTITPLSAAARKAMTPSAWRKGCPVGLSSLRAVRVRYVGFDGRAQLGTIVVHRAHAERTVRAFRALYVARFPVRRIHPIERYRGSDDRSIDADNTSAFNCRRVTGGTGWSEHAYGRAIDLNPIENPYILGGRTSHKASERFLDRSRVRPGMAVEGSIAVKAFTHAGFRWGGRWTNPVDTQHFSTTGR
ncbi:MAG: M15 family metallopeptidase [Solirubrobacteraceae bacterium]|nr:M15 family metallopeptidase [Solirubrobacteraceae bacterium]